jgi:hypothetical protein
VNKVFSWLFGTDSVEPSSVYGERPFVAACIEAFRVAPIAHKRLESHGISELGVCLPDGVKIVATWYSGMNHPRDLSVNGNKFTTTEGDGNKIIRAAIQRADNLFAEESHKMDARYSRPQGESS